MIKTLNDLIQLAAGGERQRVAVVAAHEQSALSAIMDARDAGIAEPVLIGDQSVMETIAKTAGIDLSGITIINETDLSRCAEIGVEMVKAGNADLLMKGLISTGPLLKAVLNKETGLNVGRLASHVAVFLTDQYHKPLVVTDAAINIAPDLNVKKDIIQNAVVVVKSLGIQNPKVAVLAAVEKVNPKMEATLHAEELTRQSEAGEIPDCKVYGPLALDNAVSKEAAEIKGITSDVAGDADILLANDIETGNVLYKCLGFLGRAEGAGVVMGAAKPVILTSRADDRNTKLGSVALGVLAARVLTTA